MSKVNVQEVLMQKGKESQYAIVKYNIKQSERIMAFYFRHDDNGKEFLPYLCLLMEKWNCKDNNEAEKLFEFFSSKSIGFKKKNHIVIDEKIYEIERTKLVVPCLPKEVDAIIPITEKEFILYKLEFEPIILYKLNLSESLDMKWDSTESMRKGFIETGKFDADTIDKIMEVFSNTAADYSFKRK